MLLALAVSAIGVSPGPVPDATTLDVTRDPAKTAWLAGWVVIAGDFARRDSLNNSKVHKLRKQTVPKWI